MKIIPLPAFNDNYIWLLHNDHDAWVVDPGAADGVLAYLTTHHLALAGILLTHRHADHVGGVAALCTNLSARRVPVVGPRSPLMPMVTQVVAAGEHITLAEFHLSLEVLAIPGHTDEHIAYFAAATEPANPPRVWCGDTLFAAGCGRVFEGSAARLYDSLQRLAQLPSHTLVYCGHEYTEANLRFALTVEPDNVALHARQRKVRAQRAQGQPSVPSTMAEEWATNPFLRVHLPALRHAAQQREPTLGDEPVEVFRVLREWKTIF